MSRVLVVGDVMLDEFVYGDVHRISPEAATPVLAVTRTERMIGGAGNVARGIAALDCPCDFLTVVNGGDQAGRDVMRAIQNTPHLTGWITVAQRPTTRKTRFVSAQHSSHLLRVDHETTEPIDRTAEQSIISNALSCIKDVDVLVLSDYCKGVITETVAIELIAEAKASGKIIIVDSKRADLAMYQGATIVKLNLCELGFCYDEPDMDVIADAARTLANTHDFDDVLVTRGENGLSVFGRGSRHDPIHVPGRQVHVRDVSGAGDTVVATLATILASGYSLQTALERANAAAAIAVSKPGTAVVSLAELRGGTKVAPGEDWSLVDQRVREWRGEKIGFVNGCFDLLHTGHLHLLTTARAYCDKLIVGINSDESVKAIKGEGRPVRSHVQRAEVLAALTDLVDLVVIFGDDPAPLIERIKPDALFVGDDYQSSQVKGREFAGALHIIPRLPDVSTTATIERMGGPRNDPELLKPWVPTGPAVERDRAVKEGCRYCDGGDDCTGACLNGHGKILDDYCEQCQGPCLRRPRHGEFNI